jgi:hypothetical protein
MQTNPLQQAMARHVKGMAPSAVYRRDLAIGTIMRMSRTDLVLIVAVLGCAGLGLGAMGCEANVPIHDNTADVHDNEVNADVDANFDFDVQSDVNVDNVEPGDSVIVTMNATGVVLVEPDGKPSSADSSRAAHFKIFLDNVDSAPLLVTASASASVTIPQGTPPGDHKLICRMFKHDGSPLGKTREISIKVQASASVTTGSGGAGTAGSGGAGTAGSGGAGTADSSM